MSLNPIVTVAKLEEQYKEFLSAQFCFRNEELNEAAKNAIALEADLFHGPYIEASIGIYNIFKLLHIEYVRRLTYTDGPGIQKDGIRFMVMTVF